MIDHTRAENDEKKRCKPTLVFTEWFEEFIATIDARIKKVGPMHPDKAYSIGLEIAVENLVKERDKLRARVAELEAGIRQHKSLFKYTNKSPTELDVDLWSLVEAEP
jgi:hypothetical protein